MRRRFKRFLPIVVIALAMQVLAPIAACWAAGAALADPLQTAPICHDPGPAAVGADDRPGAPPTHGGTCSICALAQANASLDAPQAIFPTPLRLAAPVVWQAKTFSVALAHDGSNAQARAPPHLG